MLLSVLTLGGLGLLLYVVFNISEVFENVDKHGPLFLYICLVGVPDEVHVNFAVGFVLSSPALSTFFGVLFLSGRIERFLFVKMVKVFVRYFAGYAGLIWRNLIAHSLPIKVAEKRMCFNFVRSVLS